MSDDSNNKQRVLMVCLGNICRSPLAEAALRRAANEAGLGLHIDSAGTGDWHIGHPPDVRAQAVARAKGVDIGHYRARQVARADFDSFDHILAMDRSNHRNLLAIQPANAHAQLSMLLDHLPGHEGRDVADPYYGDDSDFEACWHLVDQAARAFVERFRAMSGFA
jgi:protein-tyrosine phosphatase